MEFHSLKDVLQAQLEDLHSAETQLVEALPTMAQRSHHEELREVFEQHFDETRGQLYRTKEALGELGVAHPTEISKGMEGLIAAGAEMMRREGDPLVKDAALIGAAQRIEHYEIAGYGTARQLADDCGYGGMRELLEQTLYEESQADKTLTKIATGGMFRAGVNQKAVS